MSPKIPLVRFEVVLQQVLAPVHPSHFEIVGEGPLRIAFERMPAVEHFRYFDCSFFVLPSAGDRVPGDLDGAAGFVPVCREGLLHVYPT